MAKSQLLQPEASLEKKKSKQAMKDKKKMKRKKTEYEESETCVPADDVSEVKKKKADINDITTLERKKKKKQRKTKSKSSDEFICPAEADQPAEAQMNEVEEEGMEGGNDLTPEERRVLERKLKKIRRKEEKKKQKEEEKKEKSEKEGCKTSVAQKQALEYLTCWSEKREEWKFQKTRQVWLLQHMFDSEKVSDAHFAVLLSYLEGLQGVARETTVQKAETLVRWGGQEDTEGGAAESERRAHRAKDVIQILS